MVMDIKFMKNELLVFENMSGVPGTVDPRIGPDYIYQNPGVAVPYLIIICLATLTGTLGNILVICAVWADKELRSVGNMFIVNLAFADFCVTAFVDPFSIVGIIYGEIWFEDKPALCELIASLCLTACFCSLLSIGAISLNRYIHICRHHLYSKIYTFRNTLLMCVGLWVVSFLAEMPNFLGWGDHVFDRKTLSCVWDRTAALSYSIFFSTAGVAFPVFLISVCYAMIYKHVRDSRRKVKEMNAAGNAAGADRNTESQRKSKQLARTLFIIFVVFAACWGPYAFVVSLDYNDTYPQELHIFAVLIAHTNSSLNSVLYGISNSNFRYAYFRLLGLKRFIPNSGGPRDTDVTKTTTTNVVTTTQSPAGISIVSEKKSSVAG